MIDRVLILTGLGLLTAGIVVAVVGSSPYVAIACAVVSLVCAAIVNART